jgi:hypothetical protein
VFLYVEVSERRSEVKQREGDLVVDFKIDPFFYTRMNNQFKISKDMMAPLENLRCIASNGADVNHAIAEFHKCTPV